MTRKEIMNVFRFTNRVHNSFKKPTVSLASMFERLQNLEYHLKWITRKADQLGLSKVHASDWYAISTRAIGLKQNAAFWETPKNVFSCYQPILFSDLSLGVLSLVRKGARILMSNGTIKLIVYVPDITLKDRNGEEHVFENLRVEFLPSESGLTVFVNGPEYADSGYCHPHINDDGALCEGEGDVMIPNALKTCDVVATFDLVEALLKTYNPESPFFELGEATGGPHCNQCGDRDDDMSCCANCGDYVCDDCYRSCRCGDMEFYDGYLCPGCMRKCADCKALICDNCETLCAVCKKYHCSNCVSSCADGAAFVCDVCSDYCEVCDATLCPECKEANHDECENKEDEGEEGEVEETG